MSYLHSTANGISDCLSWGDHNLSDCALTLLLRHCIPEQVPQKFHISPLPNKIVSWLTSLMWVQPDKMPPPKVPTRSNLQLSANESNFLVTLDSETTPSWTDSPSPSCTEPLEPLQLPCKKVNTLLTDMTNWWQGPLPPPWTMWHQPFGLMMALMKMVEPHTFYSNKKQLQPHSSECLPTCEPPSKTL